MPFFSEFERSKSLTDERIENFNNYLTKDFVTCNLLLLSSRRVPLVIDSSSETEVAPSGSFLCFRIIFRRSASGEGIAISFFSMGIVSSIEPKISSKILAIFLCCGSEQWSSIDKMTG